MSNSSLVDVIIESPNCNSPRNNKIQKITIHHMAAVWTVERCGECFANPNRQASSNYGIDSDGRVGLYVSESDRAWTSGNAENDNQAVTIEVSNCEMGGDWAVSDKAYEKLIDLCVDICQRNGIQELNYTGDTSGNLTIHKMFQATVCPGPYLEARMSDIANQVNKRLQGESDVDNSTNEADSNNASCMRYKIGDEVSYNKIYATSNSYEALTPIFTEGIITNIVYGAKNPYMIGDGTGWINDGCIVGSSQSQKEETSDISEGDIVHFIGEQDYDGTYITPYHNHYTVMELDGDRVVLGYEGQVFAAVHICDVEKI